MLDEEIQALTASEPLTLAQEYEMQASWQQDEDNDTIIGDVNLFLQGDGVGELEVMVAEQSMRRKGYARAAVLMFMAYIYKHLQVSQFQVKIGASNLPSIQLFTSLGFTKHKFAEYFQEWELQLDVEANTLDKITQLMQPSDRNWTES